MGQLPNKVCPHALGNEDRIAKTLLDLAQVNPADFLPQEDDIAVGTARFFDKRAASTYLSRQFRDLWKQKTVGFHLEIEGNTLSLFAEDETVGMPVSLHRRSSGFRWLAGFTWQFTQASSDRYAGCVLLLEEPGIHLHFSGQRDLREVLERLSARNTVLYTTHLPALINPFHPERIRSVRASGESRGRTEVGTGLSDEDGGSLAVIEAALGLSPDMRALLGSRQTLLVESGNDALILHKLSQILGSISKPHLAGRLYLWPTQGALQTPLYAALAAGLGWNCGILLDSDDQGRAAREQIERTVLIQANVEQAARLRSLSLGEAAGLPQQSATVEDLFDPTFYIDCVNTAFGIAIKETDLPDDGNGLCQRVAHVLSTRYGHATLERRRILEEMLRRIDGWEKLSDLPRGTSAKAEKLFLAINNAFGGRAERVQQQRA